MADIKNYLKEREKREKNQINYKEKIWKYKLTTLYRILLLAAVLIAVVVLVCIQYDNHIYTGYDTIGSIPREKASGALDFRLKDSILTYSKDGAHCTDAKGNVTWNQTYEMQEIKLAACRDVVAIASYNGRNIYMGNTKELIGEITTTMPIRDLTVSASGYVTAVLTDADATWVNTYNSKGENIYSGMTHMSNSGYPESVSLSPNGELLAVSYVYVDAGTVKTNIAFYNFGPVGDNQSDHMMSVYTYSDCLVPTLHFMDNETMFAVGDSRLMFYKGAQKPVSEKECLFDEKVQAVFYNEKYVGLVFLSDKADSRYRMDVYSVKTEKTGSFYFNMEYNDIFFEEDAFVVYNETECMVMTFAGVEKYNGFFTKSVNMMIPTSSAYRYLLVTDTSIDTIQLK